MNKDNSLERVVIKVDSFLDELEKYDFSNTDQTGAMLIYTGASGISDLQTILKNTFDKNIELQNILDKIIKIDQERVSTGSETIRKLRNQVLDNMEIHHKERVKYLDGFYKEKEYDLKRLEKIMLKHNTVLSEAHNQITSLHVQKDIIEKVLTDKWIEADNPRRAGTDATKQRAISWQEKINNFVVEYANTYPYNFVGDECSNERELKNYVDTKLLTVRDENLRTKTGKSQGKFKPPVVSKIKLEKAIDAHFKKKASLLE
jgi:hypothetical protein